MDYIQNKHQENLIDLEDSSDDQPFEKETEEGPK